MQKKKVILFGTFDIFHSGHKNFIYQAKSLGDFLIIVVARDNNVKKIKNKLPKNNEQIRKKNIEIWLKKKSLEKNNLTFKNVNVILGNKNLTKNRYLVLKEWQPEMICLGYDQKVNTGEEVEKLKKYNLKNTKIKRLKSYKPKTYKSSKLKILQKYF